MSKKIYIGVNEKAVAVKNMQLITSGTPYNLVTNSVFDTTDGWQAYSGTSTTISIVPEGKTGACMKIVSGVNGNNNPIVITRDVLFPYDTTMSGHKIYYRGDIKSLATNTNVVRLILGSVTGVVTIPNDGEWHTVSNILTIPSPISSDANYRKLCIKPHDSSGGAGDIHYLDNVFAIDLTEVYGADNEPTKEWCDAQLSLENLPHSVTSSKIKKAYIGVDGKARLFYSPEQLIPFTSSPLPKTWTKTSYLEYYADSEYGGKWIATSSVAYSQSNNNINLAFDGSTSTYYRSSGKNSDNAATVIYLTCPERVSINPTEMIITHRYCGNSSYQCKVHGSIDNSTWEELCTIPQPTSTSIITNTFSVTKNKYYKYFRIWLYRYSSNTSYNCPYLYEVQFSKGTMKIE